MPQETFEARHGSQWLEFEQWLDAMTASRTKRSAAAPALAEAAVAHRYRCLCQHLALARERRYSPGLVARLNGLVIRGHQFLYGAHLDTGPALVRFFARDLARAVRTQWRPIAWACALFFGPLIVVAMAMQQYPDLVHMLMPAEQIAAYEQMYDPAQRRAGERGAQVDSYMLGHYIWNNVRIGFQTFAGGMLFGIGTVFFLTVNGVLIGASAGHLIEIGFARTFFGFVSGHSALELGGIVLMGAAGLMLGGALIAPGRLTRASALRLRAKAAVPLVYGAGAMLTAAAFVEAFWSPLGVVPAPIKYAAGAVLWTLVLLYFIFAGRTRAP
ncbi:MAG: stage II sporulation protein M [Burkholderiales bacterium]|nr:stage II sporulation protein M [Burkholderiales bacterium]